MATDLLNSNECFIYLQYIWRFMGIYPFTNFKWFYNIYAVLANIAGSILSPLFVFLNMFFLKDVGLIMLNLQISPTIIVASLKQLIVFLKMKNLGRVHVYLQQLDKRARLNKNEILYLKRVVRQCNMLVLLIEVLFTCSLMSYVVPALVKKRLILEGWFPLDWTLSRRNYLIAMSFQLFGTVFQVVQNMGNDAYPLVYMNITRGQIHALRIRIERIGKDSSTTLEENFIELRACINDYKVIMRLFETVKEVVSKTVTLQFVITAFVLCISLIYYLFFNREFGQLISTLIYMAGVMSECYVVCHFGNELMYETDLLTTSIYSCNWVDQSVKFRKCIIIFMQRSQKTNIILAGLTTISLQTFVGIIRFSFSVFTVLSQLG